VRRDTIVSLTAAVTLGLGALAAVESAQAAMFDFMNPGQWFGGDRHDRYYDHDYYRYGRYGYGPYGWGRPWGGYGPYGWGGGPWGGYGGPWGGGWGGYPGYGGYGGYGPGSTIVVTPQSSGSSEKQAAPPPKLPE